MVKFTNEDLTRAVAETSALMDENKDRLIELDSAIGDGDLGLTMGKGFAAAAETAKTLDDADTGTRMRKIGMAIAKAVPSTMGTLMATAFMGAGKALPDKEGFTAEDVRLMFESMAEAIDKRAPAAEGDKTLLDVLYPAARAARAQPGEDVAAVMGAAHRAALAGLEATRGMMSQHGKAAVFREKTLGLLDPGGAAAALLVEGFARACGAV